MFEVCESYAKLLCSTDGWEQTLYAAMH